jgi:hypothetical protein
MLARAQACLLFFFLCVFPGGNTDGGRQAIRAGCRNIGLKKLPQYRLKKTKETKCQNHQQSRQ